jgi:hypothetical protein
MIASTRIVSYDTYNSARTLAKRFPPHSRNHRSAGPGPTGSFHMALFARIPGTRPYNLPTHPGEGQVRLPGSSTVPAVDHATSLHAQNSPGRSRHPCQARQGSNNHTLHHRISCVRGSFWYAQRRTRSTARAKSLNGAGRVKIRSCGPPPPFGIEGRHGVLQASVGPSELP